MAKKTSVVYLINNSPRDKSPEHATCAPFSDAPRFSWCSVHDVLMFSLLAALFSTTSHLLFVGLLCQD